MTSATISQAPRYYRGEYARPDVHGQGIRRIDLTGALIWVTPVLLAAYFLTSMNSIQLLAYGLCAAAALPYLGPFVTSLRRNDTNLTLVLLFATLAISTAAAFDRVPTATAFLQAKALAATALWASVYVVVFGSLRTRDDHARLMKWVKAAAFVITLSVYVSFIAHRLGFEFGEVLEFRDGTVRAFGPLGDQVGFVLVLPAVISLVASNPLMFAFYTGALLLTATRGAALCLVVALVVYIGAAATGQIKLTRRSLAWTAVALIAGSMLWLTPAATVLMGRLGESTDESGFSLRLTAIQTGFTVFLEHPVVGLGFNGFDVLRPAVYVDWLSPNVAVNGLSRAANQYVQTATDGGVVALIPLLLFALCVGRNALRIAKWSGATPELIAAQVWVVSVLIGNQGALWLLSSTATGFFVMAVAGMGAHAAVLNRQQGAGSSARTRIVGASASA